jgi:primosomal protein N''
MSISPIGSVTDGSTNPSIAAYERAIAQLKAQIAQVQKQINDEKFSKDNAVTQAELVQTYTQELDGLQTQLVQIQGLDVATNSGAAGPATTAHNLNSRA